MCLQGTAKIWFQQLDTPTSSNIEKIFSVFLLRFKHLGPDWSREAFLLSLRQMPQENSQQFANSIVTKEGHKIRKIRQSLSGACPHLIESTPSHKAQTPSMALPELPLCMILQKHLVKMTVQLLYNKRQAWKDRTLKW